MFPECSLQVSQQGGSLPHITTLTDYLENYYHPSNGGQWTSALTTFLRHSTNYFVKRLASEANRERLGQVVGNPINAEQRGIIIQVSMVRLG
jgi:proteasome activator subunit 4